MRRETSLRESHHGVSRFCSNTDDPPFPRWVRFSRIPRPLEAVARPLAQGGLLVPRECPQVGLVSHGLVTGAGARLDVRLPDMTPREAQGFGSLQSRQIPPPTNSDCWFPTSPNVCLVLSKARCRWQSLSLAGTSRGPLGCQWSWPCDGTKWMPGTRDQGLAVIVFARHKVAGFVSRVAAFAD